MKTPGLDPNRLPLNLLSIVIPARDEEGCIASTVEHLFVELRLHGVPHEIAGTLDHAVPAALEAAREKGARIVLLSPACASFDQFSGFEARGETFAALVAEIACESVA